MKIRRWGMLLLAFCLVFFTGCDAALFNPEAAIKAPGTTGLYQGVQEALEAAVGQDIILKYPLVENTNTAFCPRDLDGDGIQEMLAFYQQRSEGAVTRIHIIRNTGGVWQSVQDLDPLGSNVANVGFCDLNGDGKEEVCVGWSIYTSQSNRMSVYQMVNGLLVQRAAEDYTDYVVCDIDGDGVQELGLALLDTQLNSSTLSFYELKAGNLLVSGRLALDGSVVAYAKMTAAKITDKNVGVYLDAYKGADSTITELVYFKGGQLYNPFASAKDASNVATLRYCSLTASDINADGVMEIPFMETLPGYKPEDDSLPHHTIGWRYFNGNISDTVATWWYNPQMGYYLEIDTAWQNKITVVYDQTQDAYVFYEWTGEAIGGRLFSIKAYTADQWDGRTNMTYTQLQTNSEQVWAVSLEKNNSLSISYEKLKESFHLIIK